MSGSQTSQDSMLRRFTACLAPALAACSLAVTPSLSAQSPDNENLVPLPNRAPLQTSVLTARGNDAVRAIVTEWAQSPGAGQDLWLVASEVQPADIATPIGIFSVGKFPTQDLHHRDGRKLHLRVVPAHSVEAVAKTFSILEENAATSNTTNLSNTTPVKVHVEFVAHDASSRHLNALIIGYPTGTATLEFSPQLTSWSPRVVIDSSGNPTSIAPGYGFVPTVGPGGVPVGIAYTTTPIRLGSGFGRWRLPTP